MLCIQFRDDPAKESLIQLIRLWSLMEILSIFCAIFWRTREIKRLEQSKRKTGMISELLELESNRVREIISEKRAGIEPLSNSEWTISRGFA